MLLILMSISIVFDISQKIKDFVSNDLSISEIIFDYYVHFVIFYSNMFGSLIIFLSVIWFTSIMASRTEIVPILSGGVSYNRFLYPYFIAASILFVFSIVMNHWIVPYSNQKRADFESRNTRFHVTKKNIFLEPNKGTIVFYGSMDIRDYYTYDLWVENWEQSDNGEWKLKSTLQAKSADGDSTSYNWKISNYFIREIVDGKELLKKGNSTDTTFTFRGIDLGQRDESASALNTKDLNEFRQKEIEKGSESVVNIDIERYQRTAMPFATYILTLIGVTVSSRKSRGGIGLNIALGLSVVMLFLFFQRMGQVAAVNSGMHPILAVWLPNIIFAIVGLLFYKKAPK